MMIRFFFKIFFLCLLSSAYLTAEDFSVQFQDKIGLKEQLVVTVKVTDSSATPEFISEDFTSSGQISYSSSIQIVNFSKPQKTVSYRYALNPQKIGKSVFKVKVDNKTQGPFEVQVTESPVSNQPKASNPTTIFGRSPSAFSENEAFVKNELKKKIFYINEPIEVIRTVYHRANISGVQMVKREEFKGFGREANKIFNNKPRVVTQNGFSYKASPVESFVLFPHLAGKTTLKGGVILLQKRGGFFNNRSKKFNIPDQTITIKDFPAKNKPKNFSRAVGDFSFTLQADKQKIKTHDPITLKLTISGQGNFHSIIPPEINLTQKDIDVKQSSTKNEFVMKNGSHDGKKIIEYYLIPTKAMEFTLPPISFSFFHSKTKNYKTIVSKPISFKVLERARDNKLSSVLNSRGLVDVELLKKDIRYIKTKRSPKGNQLIKQLSAFFICLSFFVAAFTYLYYLRKKDLFFFKNRQKKEMLSSVKKALKKITYVEDDKEFFSKLQEIIFYHLSKQFEISTGYSTSQIKNKFKEDKSLYPIINSLMEVVTTCQSYQFAPENIVQDKEKLIEKTLFCFQEIENLS